MTTDLRENSKQRTPPHHHPTRARVRGGYDGTAGVRCVMCTRRAKRSRDRHRQRHRRRSPLERVIGPGERFARSAQRADIRRDARKHALAHTHSSTRAHGRDERVHQLLRGGAQSTLHRTHTHIAVHVNVYNIFSQQKQQPRAADNNVPSITLAGRPHNNKILCRSAARVCVRVLIVAAAAAVVVVVVVVVVSPDLTRSTSSHHYTPSSTATQSSPPPQQPPPPPPPLPPPPHPHRNHHRIIATTATTLDILHTAVQ